MPYTFKNDDEARSVAHHLQVAAMRYHDNERSVALPTVAASFARQAEECQRISAEITEVRHLTAQESAARAMLAALEAALCDLSHTARCLPKITAAIDQAEAAGIIPEGTP